MPEQVFHMCCFATRIFVHYVMDLGNYHPTLTTRITLGCTGFTTQTQRYTKRLPHVLGAPFTADQSMRHRLLFPLDPEILDFPLPRFFFTNVFANFIGWTDSGAAARLLRKRDAPTNAGMLDVLEFFIAAGIVL